MSMEWIEAEWPAPPWVRALTTTRLGGVSGGVYAGLNLGDHVGDDPDRVAINRERLRRMLNLPAEPYWLRQVHGCEVSAVPSAILTQPCEADAAIAWGPDQVCAVLTADCLPVLLTDRSGTRVAAVHAGWRGLAAGVIEAAVARLGVRPTALLAWLGPAIGPGAFKVGAEVREVFLAQDQAMAVAFSPCLPTPCKEWEPDIGQAEDLVTAQEGVLGPRKIPEQRQGNARGVAIHHPAVGFEPGKWQTDLYHLARLRLARLGVSAVWGGGFCTYQDSRRFYSYRRDGVTGRMASLIWIDPRRRVT